MAVYLDIDMSELKDKLQLMRGVLSQREFEQLLQRTIGEMARKTKTLTAREVVKDYAVPQYWVKEGIGGYRMRPGGLFPISAEIPLSGKRGIIGGRFKLRRPETYRKKRQIYATIVKTGPSRMPLPPTMDHQGGNAPFIGRGKIDGLVFTRNGPEKKPIARVGGLSMAQMPLNRSAKGIQNELLDYADERLDHHFMRMLQGKW